MTKTHKYKTTDGLKTWKQWFCVNPDRLAGSKLGGRSAANIDQREALEEMAIIKRL
jgi:hypothetical protein